MMLANASLMHGMVPMDQTPSESARLDGKLSATGHGHGHGLCMDLSGH